MLSHPECNTEVLKLSDYIGSTSGIIKYATESPCNEFIICTEEGVHYKLVQNNPDKHFYYPKTVPVCPNMKKNTLEKVLHVLKTGRTKFMSVTAFVKIQKTSGTYVRAWKVGI